MKCPVCKTDTLGSITLIEDLPAHQCSNCRGIFMPSNAYLIWKRMQGQEFPPKESDSEINPNWDAEIPKICPSCAHIMKRYKVLPETSLFLDRCGNCSGVWFDNHEWDALVERNLHDNVNEFFTRPWQDHLHAEETRSHMEKIYSEKFGEEDYQRIKDVREWLRNHPHLGMLLAYLQADDPYKV